MSDNNPAGIDTLELAMKTLLATGRATCLLCRAPATHAVSYTPVEPWRVFERAAPPGMLQSVVLGLCPKCVHTDFYDRVADVLEAAAALAPAVDVLRKGVDHDAH
jgi:hypothetical protein